MKNLIINPDLWLLFLRIALVTGAGLAALFETPQARAQAQCYPHWIQLYPAQSWTNTYNSGPLRGHALAYDSRRDVTLLFGGTAGWSPFWQNIKETWEFNGKTWTQRFPATVPAARAGHVMSYDPVLSLTVMLGGTGDGFTWAWDGVNWNKVTVQGNSPPEGSYQGMVYDEARGVHVLYLGYTITPSGDMQTIPETWEYDAWQKTWTLRTTNGPVSRFGTAIAYDKARQQVVLFGGYCNDRDYHGDENFGVTNDTWILDGHQGEWHELNPAHKPVPRYYHSLVFDDALGGVVMLGGQYIDQIFDYHNHSAKNTYETWVWNGTDWEDRTPAFLSDYRWPDGLLPGQLAYETSRQQVVFFAQTGILNLDPMLTWALTDGRREPVCYVDRSNNGFPDGSQTYPYPTVKQAVSCTLGGNTISIQSGDYAEGPLEISKQLEIIATGGSVTIH